MNIRRSAVIAGLTACALIAAPAAAQDITRELGIVLSEIPTLPDGSIRPDVHLRHFPPPPPARERRPRALVPMYGTLVALNGLDVHSTGRAIAGDNGREANPVMQPVVRNRWAFVAVKGAASAGVIWIGEKVWRRDRRKAVLLMTVVNAAMAAVVANNYRVATR